MLDRPEGHAASTRFRLDPSLETPKLEAAHQPLDQAEIGAAHSVRLLSLGSKVVGIMHPGESVRFAFTAPGTYPYDCSFHAQAMQGTVIVTSP